MTAKMIFCIFFVAITVVNGDKDYTDGHSSILLMEKTNFIASNNDNGKDVHLVFRPNMLDFEDLAVGDAESETVIVFNEHANKSVFFGSISGNVPDFYSSFFEEKVIPPMGNTTFNVVFLPRQPGMIQTNLLIHTSFGAFNYTVKGRGVECMFRLNPLIGLQAPLNATLTPEIVMYNPYETPLQIIEVYSSGGQFQLELPGGSGNEGPQALWHIPPFTSKPIIRVRFIASHPGNHSAYIRIKVSSEHNAELEDLVLVVPIEVEISNYYGIYSEAPFLNLGLGGTEDRPKKFTINLFNSGKEPVSIENYSVESESSVSHGITVSVEASTDPNVHSTITATVDWTAIKTDKYIRGSIVITAIVQNKNVIYRIPFVGEILKGSIYFNESSTKFVTTENETNLTRDFLLKNNFEMTLAITNVTLPNDCSTYFKTSEFTPKILEPGEESVIFKLSLLDSAAKLRHLLLHTSISTYEIPVSSYNGLLRRIVPVDETTNNGRGVDEKSINFGTLQLSTMSDTVVAFVNDNPVPITIHNWTGTISGVASIHVILRGCGNLTMENLKFCYFIQPGEWIVFQISVFSNAVGTFIGKLTVKTDYEELTTPIKFTTAMGKLDFTTTAINEELCFPGGECKFNLTVFSTFNIPMSVEQILVNANGVSANGVTYHYNSDRYPEIAPNKLTHIGQFKFNPKAICGADCFLEYPDQLPPATISSNCKQNHTDLMKTTLEAYRAMKQSFDAIQFRVQTSQVRRFTFNSSANLIWPQMVIGPVEFPLTPAGHEVVHDVIVYNPTNETIMAYYALHDVAQNGHAVGYPPETINFCWECFLSRENVFSFVHRRHKNQEFDYIPPRSRSKVSIRFSAESVGSFATLLYIRNNFTVLEVVWLTAKAGVYQFKFGNRKPGSETPLLFELSEKHLRDCDKQLSSESLPFNVTARRTFTAKNHGDMPIKIDGIYIGGELCKGFGFKVSKCYPFELPPNGSHKIEITFKPDFTQARVVQTLTLKTSLDYPINYTLVGTIPPQALNECSKALQRPTWEPSLRYTLLFVLTTAFVLVFVAAYMDYGKVMTEHFNILSKKGPVYPPLDLKISGLPTQANDDDSKTSPTASFRGMGVPFQRKKQDKKRVDIDIQNKKTWADVLGKRTSPIQSDVRIREESPPPQPNHRLNESKREKVKTCREVLTVDKAKVSEDDSAANTSEVSQHPLCDSSNDGKRSKPSKQANVSTEPQTETKLPSKSKAVVKKSKSLPINAPDNKETEPAQPKPVHPIATKTTTPKDPETPIADSNRPTEVLKETTNLNTSRESPEEKSQVPKKYVRPSGRERKKTEEKRRPTNRGAVSKDNPIQTSTASTIQATTIPPMWDYVFDSVNDVEVSEVPLTSTLGPIGTRKSPASTPTWEPMQSIQKPIATAAMNNSNSFFSNSFPQYSPSIVEIGGSAINDEELMAGASGPLDNVRDITNSWNCAVPYDLVETVETQQKQFSYTNSNNFLGLNSVQIERTWSSFRPSRPPPPPGLSNRMLMPFDNVSNAEYQMQNVPQYDPFGSILIWSKEPWTPGNPTNPDNNRNPN
ncbi:Transmembrane protein, partial [Pseudolycoriella hygida]